MKDELRIADCLIKMIETYDRRATGRVYDLENFLSFEIPEYKKSGATLQFSKRLYFSGRDCFTN